MCPHLPTHWGLCRVFPCVIPAPTLGGKLQRALQPFHVEVEPGHVILPEFQTDYLGEAVFKARESGIRLRSLTALLCRLPKPSVFFFSKTTFIYSFIFQFRLTFHIISHVFQGYGRGVRQSYTLQSAPPCFRYPPGSTHSYRGVTDDVSCAGRYIRDYSVIANLYFLIPAALSPSLPAPSPLATTSPHCVSESVSILFLYLVLRIPHMSGIMWHLPFSA